jgi:hypothetical protein
MFCVIRGPISGFLALVLWLAVHLLALTGFKTRASCSTGRSGSSDGGGRSVETTQQVVARRVREEQAALLSREAAAFRDR